MFNFGGFGFDGHSGHHGHRAGGAANKKPVNTNKFYEVLGIEKNATAAEIKKAFRKAAIKHHPDKGGDEELFKECRKAYEVLSNPEKREIYDKYGEEGVENGGPQMEATDIFDLFTGGRRGGRRGGNTKRKGRPVDFPLNISLEDLYNGCKKKLRLTRNVLCSTCSGKGTKSGKSATCQSCHGRGVKVHMRQLGPGMIQQMQTTCNECSGTGQGIDPSDRCDDCDGKKITKQKENLEVFVNKGMKDRSVITFEGKGDESPDTLPGDVRVILRQKEHPVYTRKGMHLFMKKKIKLVDALTGFTMVIQHLDGRKIVVNHKDSIIRPGDVKAISEEGMPQQKNPFNRGTLFIEFEIEFPESIKENTQKLLRKILPAPISVPKYDLNDENVEENEFQDIDVEAELQRQEQMKKEAYDDDDEEMGGPRTASCQSQ